MSRIQLQKSTFFASLALFAATAVACDDGGDDHDHDHDHDHETEVISHVVLTFTPDGGGDAVVAEFDDPDGDGGMSGTSTSIDLVAGTTYELSITMENALEDPPEDITGEIEEEAEEHMLFFGGDVMGPSSDNAGALVTHAYADMESDYGSDDHGDDLPVGLVNTITADTAGTGEFQLVMRHIPELNDEPQKTADLPGVFADGGTLPGENDLDLTFDLNVQ